MSLDVRYLSVDHETVYFLYDHILRSANFVLVNARCAYIYILRDASLQHFQRYYATRVEYTRGPEYWKLKFRFFDQRGRGNNFK